MRSKTSSVTRELKSKEFAIPSVSLRDDQKTPALINLSGKNSQMVAHQNKYMRRDLMAKGLKVEEISKTSRDTNKKAAKKKKKKQKP